MFLVCVVCAFELVYSSGSRVCDPADPCDRTVSILLTVIPGTLIVEPVCYSVHSMSMRLVI